MGLEYLAKGHERRKHARCSIDDAKATYTTGILGLLGMGKQDAYIVDLSSGGICIRTAEKFKSKTNITLTIILEKYNDVLKAKGVLRRSFTNPKDNQNYGGVEFTSLDPAVQARLRAMCEYFNSPAYKSLRQQQNKDEPWRNLELK